MLLLRNKSDDRLRRRNLFVVCVLMLGTISGNLAGDNFVDDFLTQPWKLLPAYNIGKLAYSLATKQEIAPHDVIAAIGPVGTAVVAVAGERNTDNFVYKTHSDVLSGLSKFINDHPCGELLSHLTPATQFVCHPYAFHFRTLEDIEIPFMGGCLGLDVGSLLAPIVVDLGTMPLQMACSEWYDYRIELYSHLKGVPPEDYEYLLDLPPYNGNDSDGFVIDTTGADNSTDDHSGNRNRRGLLGKGLEKTAGHSILKLIRPTKIFNSVLTTYAKTFRGPTGRILSETTLNVLKNSMRVERAALDPMFKLTQSKLHNMVRKYYLMPDVVIRALDKSKFLTKPEKISLVQEALKRYKPNKFA